jgi:hypothetical protein
MISKENNFAYIDGANLYKGIESSGWHLDYHRFRVWLSEKYGVKKAYIFLGLIPRYKELYKYLQEAGFTLVFKEVVYSGDGRPRGNCDAELVLQATRDAYENKKDKCSILLKRTGAKISYIDEQRLHLELSQKEKAPDGDETP